MYHSPLGTWGGIILLCTSLALSCVCWVEADGFHARRALDVPCHSSLTCWHLPRHRRLCAALIGVTADLQIAQKNPRAVSICSASSQWMADKMHSSRTHTHAHASTCRFTENCSGVYKQGRQKHTHTHTHRVSKRSNTQIGWCDNTLRREMIENYWGWHLCRPARDLNPCDYIISSKRQISSLCLWQHGCREDASTCMKHLSLSSSVSIRHQKSVRWARG